MKPFFIGGAVLLLISIIGAVVWFLWGFGPPFSFYHQQDVRLMKLTSPNFDNNEMIPAKYTCDGKDINPVLAIGDVPDEAVSLSLVVVDPDAPMGSWVHWTLWNIDPREQSIAEGSTPSGAIEGKTSFGDNGYGGPCPPAGTHHYIFRIYALDIMLDLDSTASSADLETAMEEHVIAKAELVGKYQRD